ncbi:MAG: hypothetical protein ACRC7S_01615 [Cetobacterium sp.]
MGKNYRKCKCCNNCNNLEPVETDFTLKLVCSLDNEKVSSFMVCDLFVMDEEKED